MSNTTLPTVSVCERTESMYHKYSGQHERQPCFIELDCETGVLSADYNANVGPGIPSNVYHGRAVRWTIPPMKVESVNTFMNDELLPLAQNILDGYSSEWNGHNHVGSFTEDARDTMDSIAWKCQEIPESDQENYWDAADYYAGIGGNESVIRYHGITHITTDDELNTMVEEEENQAIRDGVVLHGTQKHLEMLREEAIQQFTDEEQDDYEDCSDTG